VPNESESNAPAGQWATDDEMVIAMDQNADHT
jgi:hypothetical protein